MTIDLQGAKWEPWIGGTSHLPASGTDYFSDDNHSIHEANINALRAAGTTRGCNPEGTLFCPFDPVTRARMATFLARALNLP